MMCVLSEKVAGRNGVGSGLLKIVDFRAKLRLARKSVFVPLRAFSN